MLDANWEGNIMMYEGIPSCVAIPGINGPNEKKAAFPLPIRTAAPKIIRLNTMTMVNSLKTLCRGSRLQMVDICLDSDTLDWRRTIDGDSVKWGHYKAIDGVVDKTIVDLNVKGSPYFIVADSTGTQIYRGTQFDKLRDVLNKKKIK